MASLLTDENIKTARPLLSARENQRVGNYLDRGLELPLTLHKLIIAKIQTIQLRERLGSDAAFIEAIELNLHVTPHQVSLATETALTLLPTRKHGDPHVALTELPTAVRAKLPDLLAAQIFEEAGGIVRLSQRAKTLLKENADGIAHIERAKATKRNILRCEPQRVQTSWNKVAGHHREAYIPLLRSFKEHVQGKRLRKIARALHSENNIVYDPFVHSRLGTLPRVYFHALLDAFSNRPPFHPPTASTETDVSRILKKAGVLSFYRAPTGIQRILCFTPEASAQLESSWRRCGTELAGALSDSVISHDRVLKLHQNDGGILELCVYDNRVVATHGYEGGEISKDSVYLNGPEYFGRCKRILVKEGERLKELWGKN